MAANGWVVGFVARREYGALVVFPYRATATAAASAAVLPNPGGRVTSHGPNPWDDTWVEPFPSTFPWLFRSNDPFRSWIVIAASGTMYVVVAPPVPFGGHWILSAPKSIRMLSIFCGPTPPMRLNT